MRQRGSASHCHVACYTGLMSFFSSLHRKAESSVVLIDVGSSSVAGAYVRIDAQQRATIHYTARIPLRTRNSENALADMERALAELTDVLLRDGAPEFARAVGNGKIDRVFVSVSSPWQETEVRVEQVSHKTPFRFTPHFMNDMIAAKTKSTRSGFSCINNLIISIILNGYEVTHPFGRMAHEASVVVLTSSLSCDVIDKVTATLRKTFHTHEIEFTAFAPVAYLALRDLYPHQKDFLIMDVTGEATDLVLVQHGILVEVASMPHGLNFLRRAAIEAGIATSTAEPLRAVEEAVLIDTQHNKRFTAQMRKTCEQWIQELTDTLQSLTARYALPHATFLLVDETARGFLKRLLDETSFHLGDISDESLSVVLVDPGKFATYVMHHGEARGDTFLSILALYVAREYRIPSTPDAVHLLTSAT